MTEKDIRAMYDKMSLSEERLSELEKRLDGCFDREPENIHDFDDDGLMQFDQEYKPAPRRRSPLIAAVSAAAVVLVAGGVTAAFRTGLIPTGTPVSEPSSVDSTAETEEPVPDELKHGITSEDLPEYEFRGLLDSDSLELDGSSFDKSCENDIRDSNITKSVLLAEMTVNEGDYEWKTGYSLYTVTIDKVYYSMMGISAEDTELKLVIPGGRNAQNEGCPLYVAGDRIIAALRSGEQYYEPVLLTLADIVTVNGRDIAAVHSKTLPVMSSLAGEKVLTYDRSVTANPALYYGLYDLLEYGEYYSGIAENTDRPEYTPEGSFNTADLTFSTDPEALTNILEPNFFGRWLNNGPYVNSSVLNEIYFRYNTKPGWDDVFKTLNDIECGGFAEDEKAFYMLDSSDGGMVWSILKYDPETLYRYEGLAEHDRADYADSFHRVIHFSDITEACAPGDITTLGLLKALSGYDESLAGAVKRDLTGLVDYDSVTWHNSDLNRTEFQRLGIPDEETWLLKKTDSEFSLVVRKYAWCESGKQSEGPFEEWRGLPAGTVYNGRICRYFRLDYTKNAAGKWECSDLAPLSGDPSDMDSFFSPLTDLDMFPSYMNSGEIHPEISVEYYAVENNGLTDVYAVRRLKGIFGDDVDEYDLYYRDPRTDTYTNLVYSQSVDLIVNDDGSVISAAVIDGKPQITRYRSGIGVQNVYAGTNAQSGRIELTRHGDFMLVGYDCGGEAWQSVLTSDGLMVVGCSPADEVKLTDNGFAVFNSYDGKYSEYTMDDPTQLRVLETKARRLWFEYVVESPMSIGGYFEVADGRTGMIIADPALRTYDGILKQFTDVFTDEAAQEAMSGIIGSSVIEVDGRMYSTGGARGTDLSISNVGLSIPEEMLTDTSAVLDFTIYYYDLETDTQLDSTDHYTINAVKTENGWRLDRFYYPY